MQKIDFGKIIKHSWELTWKNKWLWVLGMVLAIFGGAGGGGGGSSGASFSNNIPKDVPSPTDIKNQTSYVLGAATDYVKFWFSSIPPERWMLLGFLVLLFIIFTVGVMWVITSWAKGALIAGLDDADNDKPVNLCSVSPQGIVKIKDLIVFRLISAGLLLAIIIGLIVIVGFGALVSLLSKPIGMVFLILFGILAVLAFIVSMVIFIMLSIYAERLIVLKSFTPWQAWKKGLNLSKDNFFPTLLMGIINSTIGCFTGCLGTVILLIIFGIPGFLLIYPLFKDGFHFPNWYQAVFLIVLVMLFFSISFMIKAIFVVFNYGNWNLFFKQVFQGEKNE